eukprot:CAMPEP_0176502428 /NCGR_PEP_ID=MMETSP0200_2-20121128/14748_1 /TAXON_ID=947934 /ORGANISM="Chaetoceros sp., Strain GSL56" /LENGTH=395 /DNA_ID=CAMNT_0017901499 /DNA_START=156 /DNA_END=1343 /DNA_ORIENTATION=-
MGSSNSNNFSNDNSKEETSSKDILLGAGTFVSLVVLFVGFYHCRLRFIRRRTRTPAAVARTTSLQTIRRGVAGNRGTVLVEQQQLVQQQQEGAETMTRMTAARNSSSSRQKEFFIDLEERKKSLLNQILTKQLLRMQGDDTEQSDSTLYTTITHPKMATTSTGITSSEDKYNNLLTKQKKSWQEHNIKTDTDEEEQGGNSRMPLNSRVSSLPTFKAEYYIGSECVICCFPYKYGDIVSISKNKNCTHVFHLECMLTWLSGEHDTTCPSCRQDYLKDTISSSRSNSTACPLLLSPPDVSTTANSSSASVTETNHGSEPVVIAASALLAADAMTSSSLFIPSGTSTKEQRQENTMQSSLSQPSQLQSSLSQPSQYHDDDHDIETTPAVQEEEGVDTA